MSKIRLPHFLIAGAPRSATSWLYELADRHPDIAMAKPRSPEPKFFLVDNLYERGLSYYSSTWFDGLPERRYYGEKTTNYLEDSNACERIAHDLPEVRVVFLLRDPVARAYSNYLWSVRHGLERESFARALELEKTRESELIPELRYSRPYSYFSRGLYAELLRPWKAQFRGENMLVLRTEDVACDPREVARVFYKFIGAAIHTELADALGVVNGALPDEASTIDPVVHRVLRERYRRPNAELASLLGYGFREWDTLPPNGVV